MKALDRRVVLPGAGGGPRVSKWGSKTGDGQRKMLGLIVNEEEREVAGTCTVDKKVTAG